MGITDERGVDWRPIRRLATFYISELGEVKWEDGDVRVIVPQIVVAGRGAVTIDNVATGEKEVYLIDDLMSDNWLTRPPGPARYDLAHRNRDPLDFRIENLYWVRVR